MSSLSNNSSGLQLTGAVESVNVGGVRDVEHNGRTVRTGIFKTPTTEPQQVTGVHIGNDVQADTSAHGGVDKAVYAYAAEDYDWWEEQLGRPLTPGLFGENLTTRGIDVSNAVIGDRWEVGSAVLEVSEPRIPCYKLGIAVGVPRFQQAFAAADRPGAYLRIINPGQIVLGDTISIEPTTETSVRVADVNAIFHRDRDRAARLIDIAPLSESWRIWAKNRKDAHP